MTAVHDRPLVLIVEDDPDLLPTLSEAIREQGYRTSTASGGLEALVLLRNGLRPATVLLDRVMPEPNGDAVLAMMQKDAVLSGIPVVWMSGDPRPPDVPVAGWLAKPFSLEDLLATLADVCSGATERIA